MTGSVRVRQFIFRYQRGSRSLADNLATSFDKSNSQQQTYNSPAEDEDYDIPDEIEDVIGNVVFKNILSLYGRNILF